MCCPLCYVLLYVCISMGTNVLSALLCATLCVYHMGTNVLSALLCATLCVDQYEDQCVVHSAMCYSMCVSV